MCAKQKLQFAILEASSKRSPVTLKILKAIEKNGTYDQNGDQWILSGQILRNLVWPQKSPERQRSSLNDFFNRKRVEGKTSHAGSKTLEHNFPRRAWNKDSDIVILG